MTKQFLLAIGLTATLTLSVHAKKPAQQPKPGLFAGQGIMLGELTATSIHAQIRLTSSTTLVNGDVPGRAGIVKFALIEDVNLRRPRFKGELTTIEKVVVEAKAEHDFIARVIFKGLKPYTPYIIKTKIGTNEDTLKSGPTGRFITHPGKDQTLPVSFVVVTGMNYAKFHGDNRIDGKIHLEHNNTELPEPYKGRDKHLGYPALASISKLQPNFFVGTGDNVYYDTPKDPRAETIEEMRQKWHEQFVQPRYRALFSHVPTYWEVDDHDYRIDDGDNSGDHLPSVEMAIQMMYEQLPYAATGDHQTKTYRTIRISKDLQIWFVEGRIYRTDNAMEDGPEKTIWGFEQREWLMKTLKESDATFKIMVSPTPMVGPDDKRKFDNHTNFNGFRYERKLFFDFLEAEGLINNNFYLICGDRHWQYHAEDPTGVEEFSSGALIDANSRPGRKSGEELSTDPEGHIKQHYLQDPPSGGFLQVVSFPEIDGVTRLAFIHRNENGKVLNVSMKEAN
ncbi:MAG: alkaline phosphatase D family protein [Planctomycetota bacterium]|nr:alkaline phosphatase D family protein [Planctomycetota bacterium]